MDKKGIVLLGALLIAYLAYNMLYLGPRRQAWQKEQERIQQELKAKEAARREAETAAQGSSSAAQPGSATPAGQGGQAQAPAPAQPERDSVPQVSARLETPEHTVELSSQGGTLTHLTFKNILESRYKPVQSGAEDSRPAEPYHALHPYTEEVPSLALVPRGLAKDASWVVTANWHHEDLPGGGHRFWLDMDNGLRLVKDYTPPAAAASADHPDSDYAYHFNLTVRIENHSPEAKSVGYELWSPVGILNQDAGRGAIGTEALLAAREGRSVSLSSVVASKLQATDDDVLKVDTQGDEGWISYYGVGTHYFAAVVVPVGQGDSARHPVRLAEASSPLRQLRRIATQPEQENTDGLAHQAFVKGLVPSRSLAPGEALSDEYMIYVGPRQKKLFEDADGPYAGYGLERLVDFGWFESLSRVLLTLLFGLHAVFGNWGVSIIVLTFVVRGLILPLSIWSQKNMLRMQRLAPEINALKEKFTKKDGSMTPEQQRAFSAAQMDLFRKHSVNPVGCVGPIFLQIPVFVGLYNALSRSIELRQTPFVGWIQDLSVPDVLFRLPFKLPILGTNAFSVLPVIMIGTYLLQHALSPAPTDPRAAEQHKIMRFMFPIFGLLMYTMPSGLMIYFITSSLWSIAEMKTVKRWIEKAENEEIARRTGAATGATQFPGLQR